MDNFDELIFRAGNATEQPPLPEGGIPRQKVPAILRKTLMALFLPFVLIDLAMQKLARMILRPPFRQEGTCKRRGNCCYYILLKKPKGIFGRLHYLWNTQVHGFYTRTEESYEYEKNEVLVMGCRHLKKDGSCGNYRLRPMVCRKWPIITHFGHPKILKGCGYRAVNRKTGNPLKILDEL